MTTLLEKYNKEIAPKVKSEMGIKSLMAVPKITKITLNMGAGKWLAGSKDTAELEANLAAIAGQKTIVTKAKKAISNFKTRKDMPIGLAVTLRNKRAYEFLDKFINVVAPRIRDFSGFPTNSFDGNGNYSLGLKDIQVFPEINPESVTKSTGLQITICTSAKNDDDARLLMKEIGFPFKKLTKK